MDIREELQALRTRKRNVSPREVDRLLRAAGFEPAPGKGDHIKYAHPRRPGRRLTIDPRNPLLPAYVTAVIKAIEEVLQ